MSKIARELHGSSQEIGGHALVWASRAQIEGCKVFGVYEPYDYLVENIKITKNDDILIYPTDKIQKPEYEDIHLVFEYLEGDEIFGVVAPRSNRFYFNNDPNGSLLKEIEIYHEIQQQYPDVQRHMFGGF